jgi:hypothetical protein
VTGAERNQAAAAAAVVLLGNCKQRETLPPALPVPPEAPGNGNGEGREQRYERGLLPSGRQLLGGPGAELYDPESAMQDRPQKMQKNKNRAANSKEVGPLPQSPPAPADHLSYDHAEGDYFPSYSEAGPSGASEGEQCLSPPRAIVNHYPTSARTTTSKESSLALMADSRSVTPGTKPRMITLLIADRRHGTDDLAEVHVPLKAAGAGCKGCMRGLVKRAVTY